MNLSIINQRFIRFLCAGLLAFSFDYVLYAITQKYCFNGAFISNRGFNGVISNTISYSGGFLISFYLNRIWVFKSNYDLRSQILKYLILFIVNMIWSNMILFIMLNNLKLNTYLAKIFLIWIVTIWNYVIYKSVIFKKCAA